MTEKTQLSEENVIFVKNKLHDQLSLGAEPQNGSGCNDPNSHNLRETAE